MLTRSTWYKLIAFVLISVLGVGYTAWRYGGADALIGKRTYPVHVALKTGGGIFDNGEVTYRGVKVGSISDIQLTQNGIDVTLDVLNSAPPIPVNTEAVVADRSAVGEQYVDLRPRTTNGPFLADLPDNQRRIGEQDTRTPPPVQDLITNLDTLASSVPTGSLRTVVNELDAGLSGTGDDLGRLLDTTAAFTTAARENLPETRQLLDSSDIVLQTQQANSAEIKSFSRNLRLVAATLRGSDGDFRRLIRQAPQAALAVNQVINETGPNLTALLSNLLTVAQIAKPRQQNLEQILVAGPMIPAAASTVLPGDGTAHVGLALNLFDPLPCTKGYEGTDQRAGNGPANTTLKSTPPNEKAYCAEPKGSPINVRGSANAPTAAGSGGRVSSTGGSSGDTGTQRSTGGLNSFSIGPSLLSRLGLG